MGHTNSTANIALPQFIGTDKPTWLGDINGAFAAIDSKVGTIDADVAAVDAKADTAVSDASAAVTTATNANNTAGTASTTATQANNIANNALTVANNADGHTNQLETKVGLLANLTTTDKTSIVNAINEVNAKTITVSVSAEDVAYNNTVSGLTATDVQAAIDELASGGSGSWTLVGSQTGTNAISIPATAKEIYIEVAVDTNQTNPQYHTFYILAAELSATAKSYRNGYYADASHNQGVFILVSNTSVNISEAYSGGSDKASTSAIKLYAR